MRARAQGSVPSKELWVAAENRLRFLWCEMDIQESRLYWYTALPPSFRNSTYAFCVWTKILSLSLCFKKIPPKANNLCNGENMSTLTSWHPLLLSALHCAWEWRNVSVTVARFTLSPSQIESHVKSWTLAIFFFLAFYFCCFRMNHLLTLCHLWQWHRFPENNFLL